MAKRRAGELPPISWTKNKGDLIKKLLAEVEKPEFRLVILGKRDPSENSSGMSKAAVFKAIGKIILPDLCAIDEDAVGQRVKCKYESIYGTYKKHCKRLRQTGGGLGGNDDDGPDRTTTPDAKNLWDAIISEFPFFPTFHRLYSTRPNVNPPVIITGVGPDSAPSTSMMRLWSMIATVTQHIASGL
ncbi:hypothetical protein B0H11DRAFT_2223720 [Mycena galericulata]|nr:hypothetical protein B0H11DRAFT_2223720 [Mycena galericulata]